MAGLTATKGSEIEILRVNYAELRQSYADAIKEYEKVATAGVIADIIEKDKSTQNKRWLSKSATTESQIALFKPSKISKEQEFEKPLH